MENIWRNKPFKPAGSLRPNILLGPLIWLKAGGAADIYFRPKNIEDLKSFLAHLNPSVPITMIGAGSNILVRDGGIRGVTVKLSSAFREFHLCEKNATITVGAASSLPNIARALAEKGYTGLEFYSGIPGTVGGAITMNAGAHNQTTEGVFLSCDVITRDGESITFYRKDLTFKHRYCSLNPSFIIVNARFQVQKSTKEICAKKIKECLEYRDSTQPKNVATCGCVFKNPEGQHAWKLVQESGVDLYSGPAQISTKHANFIINQGGATAHDIEELLARIESSVKSQKGIQLEREVRIVGDPSDA
ncbi:MAG: UDP-N-acetylmuramate dehydrogenase [Alphaproteobacteria bacterium]|nr:UDP-N-acetylmuramate dehydrogenase [Alphaproteobacteria bacterium]